MEQWALRVESQPALCKKHKNYTILLEKCTFQKSRLNIKDVCRSFCTTGSLYQEFAAAQLLTLSPRSITNRPSITEHALP